MQSRHLAPALSLTAIAATSALLAGCAGDGGGSPATPTATALQPVSCADLAKQSFPNTTIGSSTLVTGGSLTVGTTTYTGLPDFCRVVASVSPTPAENIGIEVWLPASGWNGRFLGTGNGGLGGAVVYSTAGTETGIGAMGLVEGLKKGYAVANTDTGHTGANLTASGVLYPWMHNAVQIEDWGHSSIHAMTAAGKAVTRTFYAQGPSKSYFDGCSTGGAEAMEEAQYYPEDYDGIHAGNPGANYTRLMAQFIWGAQVLNSTPTLLAKLPLLSSAVLNACDALDGVRDGVIENPTACHFSPASLQCTANQDPSTCLTAGEVQAAQKIYAGPTNPRTDAEVYPGMAFGSEPGWVYIPYLANSVTAPIMQNMVYNDLSWNFSAFDFDQDVGFVDDKLAAMIDATNPDLSKFQARGGKLLMTHGWASQFDSQFFPIEYHRSVVTTMGQDVTDRFFRLFMVPGAGHCAGATGGPDWIDAIGTLQNWVEQGQAPDQIIATKYANEDPTQTVQRTRPLCPWPQAAVYSGSGSTDDAANFTCQ